MNIIYKNIESQCQINKITIGKLCGEIGIRRSLLSDLKCGRKSSLSADTLTKIASYFNVSVDYLIGVSDEKEKSPVVSNEASEIDIQILNALKELSEEQKAQALDFALFLANNSKK